MGSIMFFSVLLFSSLGAVKGEKTDCEHECDLYSGRWVYDESEAHLYSGKDCPYCWIQRSYSCIDNGRPDREFMNYRWQPNACNLPRFNAKHFLSRMRGRTILFVGDSLGVNQWQSLTCLLHKSASGFKFSNSSIEDQIFTNVTFTMYNTKVMVQRNHYLVETVKISGQPALLKIESISRVDRCLWRQADVLIFNSWHWWTHHGSSKQQWDLIEYRNKTFVDMDRLRAFEIGMNTWANWIDNNTDPKNTKVFFLGVSPDHLNGSDWGKPKRSCEKQKRPYFGSRYPRGRHAAELVVERVLDKMKTPVHLLNITGLSQPRKDGHPSFYGLYNTSTKKSYLDCSHWCLPGVPDTWNQLFYAALM